MKNTISASPSFFGPTFSTPLKQFLGVGEAGPNYEGEAENCVFNKFQ